jgi:arylsulfatase A-like enzyme
MLEALVAAAAVFYRVRTGSLLESASSGFTLSEAMREYILAAFASDSLAIAFAFAILAALWLFCAFAGRLASAAAILWAAAAAAFLAAASEFVRAYQTAFSKAFVGGEQFTGIESMLVSASAEISAPTRLVLVVIAALVPVIIVVSALAGKRRPERGAMGSALGVQKAVSAVAVFASALFALRGAPALYSGGRVAGRGSGLAAELSVNPLSALAFGPPREEKPEAPGPEGRGADQPAGRAALSSAAFNADSLEAAGAYRPIPLARKGRLNVILYFFESMSWRYFDLERDGHYAVPVMRRLAENGLLLGRHYANYPLSANTLFSVLSSRYTDYGKTMFFGEYSDVDVLTLPEILSSAGYETCFIHSGDLLYAARDKFLANRGIGKMILEKDIAKDTAFPGKVGWGADERAMIGPAIEWIQAREGPYLVMMAPVSPHHPYAIPENFPEFTDPEEPGIGEGERYFRKYLNSLHYADSTLGLLVDGLESRGLMDGTVLVMVTDHGEAFRQHRGNYNHPLFIYEENVRVPALLYGPSAIPAQGAYASITRHVDILPSILDLIGVADPGDREGESIFSPSREKMAVFHTSWTDEYIGARDGEWKFIKRRGDGREELYDLSSDPWELTDLRASRPEIAERYRAVVEGLAAHMAGQYADIARLGGRGSRSTP